MTLFFSAPRGALESRPRQRSVDVCNSRLASPGNIPFCTVSTTAADSAVSRLLRGSDDASGSG